MSVFLKNSLCFLFISMINTIALGPAFTWSNNQHCGALIRQRLDRVLATAPWIALFPSAAVYHLPPFNSDHHPILLRTTPPPPPRQGRFRIENWWFHHLEFEGICKQAFQQSLINNWKSSIEKVKRHVQR